MADDEYPLTIDYDVSAALKAGLTRAQIADYLAKETNYDVDAAREAGVSNDRIISFLTPAPPKKAAPAPESPAEPPGLGTRLKLNVREGFRETLAGETVNRIESGQVVKEQAADLQRAIDEAKAAGSQEALPAFQPTEEEKRRRAANPMLRTPGKPNPYAGMSIEQLEDLRKEALQEGERRGVEYKTMRERQERELAALPSWTDAPEVGQKIVQGGVALAGQLVGGAASPENLIGGPGGRLRQAGEGMLAYGARRLGGGAAEGALGAAAANPIVQTGKIERGEQKDFSLAEAGENIALGAGVNAAFRGLGMAYHGIRGRTPAETAKPVLDAPDVDTATREAWKVVTGEDIAAVQREGASDPAYTATRDQGGLLSLFGGLGEGEIGRVGKDYFFRSDVDGTEAPLKVWDGLVGGEGTVPPSLVAAQRDVYGRQGIRVVYFEDVPGVRFDGAVDPQQPNTIFLSNKPERNAAQVAAHETTHAMESVRLPDGTNLSDMLFRVVKENLTPEGREYGLARFKDSLGAPKRADYLEGPEGESLYTDALERHVIRELGADAKGEALQFPDYVGRVIDKVEERYGPQTARDALQKFMAGIRTAMERLRQFFIGDAGVNAKGRPLLGPAQTVSQTWFRNLGEVHDVLAQMDAAKFGETAGLRDRQGMLALPAPAMVTPPRPTVLPEAAAPAAPTTVRFYTGGDRSADGRQPWLTADLREARMAAERNGEPVRYVDLPADHPLIERQWEGPDAPPWNFGATTRVAAQLKDLEPATSPKPREPLVPDTSTLEESIAAHEAVRRETLQREAPRIEVPETFTPSREEWTQAVRLSRGWNPEKQLKAPMSLATFVRRNGGITRESPEGQDLAAAGLGRHPGLLRNKGVQADWMAQAAMDAGYELPTTTTGSGVDVNAFIRAVEDDARGKAKLYPGRTGTELFGQADQAREYRDYLSSIGLDPKGMPPDQIAWILRQDPDSARTMALGRLVHEIDPEGKRSLELANRLDQEIERAQAENRPEPGAWELGDHRDLEAPTRQELEAVHAEYERAIGRADVGRPAEASATGERPAEATGVVEPDTTAARQSEATGLGADRIAQEVSGVEQATAAGGRAADEGTENVRAAVAARMIMDEAERAGIRPDMERFAAGGEATPEVLEVIRRARGQAAQREVAFSPRPGVRPEPATPPERPQPSAYQRILGGQREGTNPTREYTTDQVAAEKNVYGEKTVRTPKQVVKDIIDSDPVLKTVIATADRYAAFNKEGTGNLYHGLRMANSSLGAFEAIDKAGTIKFKGNSFVLDKRNGGLEAIEKSLGTEAGDWGRYMVGNRAEALMGKGLENLLTPEDIRAFKGLNRGETATVHVLSDGTRTRNRQAIYLDAARRYNEFQRNLTRLALESGQISEKQAKEFGDNLFYISFYREADDTGSVHVAAVADGMSKQTFSKQLKGGTGKLRDPWDNIRDNAKHVIDAALSNRAMASAAEWLVASKNGRFITDQEYTNKLSVADKKKTTWFMKDGERQYVMIEDPEYFAAVSALEPLNNMGGILDVARGIRRFKQYAVTINPNFVKNNLINDTISTMALSGNPLNVYKTLSEGFKTVDMGGALNNVLRAIVNKEAKPLRHSDEYWNAVAAGATMRVVQGTDKAPPRLRVAGKEISADRIIDTVEKAGAFWDYVKGIYDAYKNAIALTEDINRMAVYKRAFKESGREDLAAFAARDVNDFFLSGAATAVRYITSTTEFLNPRLQGLYKIGRVVSGADERLYKELGIGEAVSPPSKALVLMGTKASVKLSARFATVLGGLALAQLALDAIYADDPDYQKRTDEDRNQYFWFRIGPYPIQIQKGFEVGVAATIAASGFEVFFDKNMTGERFAKDVVWKSLKNQLSMQFPTAIQGYLDMSANQRRLGGPIESTSMQRLQPEMRYTSDTSLVTRGAAGLIGASPLKLEYLANAYGGWLATSMLSLGDTIVRSWTNEPVRPSGDGLRWLTQGTISAEPREASRYVNMLYEQGEQIDQAYKTYRELVLRGMPAEAKEQFEKNKESILKYRQFSQVKDLESKLNQQIRMVENSREMNADQKKLAITRLTTMKNNAAKSVFVPQ